MMHCHKTNLKTVFEKLAPPTPFTIINSTVCSL